MLLITAIRMSGGSQHEHIEGVRWKSTTDGSTGQNSRSEMVDWIKIKNGKAFVLDDRSTAQVGVVDAQPPYLRTIADGRWTNNLLALPKY